MSERRKRKLKTHCKNGHELSGKNLYLSPEGVRGCKACRKKQSNKYWREAQDGATERILKLQNDNYLIDQDFDEWDEYEI